MSEEELKEATNNFADKIGEGGFGQVFKGYFRCTHVAIKLLTTVSATSVLKYIPIMLKRIVS